MSQIKVEVKCLYCNTPMKKDSDTKSIKCSNCGKVNNYDNMVAKAIEKTGNDEMQKLSDKFDDVLINSGFKKVK